MDGNERQRTAQRPAIHSICVYCASSSRIDAAYGDAAQRLGALLAAARITLVYGGGATGSMGRLADAALAAGGRVVGVLPRFMAELEWAHPGLTELRLVDDMHQRKREMIAGVDAVVALPGGCGTFEELLEALTLKRLGLFCGAIVLVNTRDYYAPLLAQLERAVAEGFMDERHRAMWSIVTRAEEVLAAVAAAPPWSAEARAFARPA